MKTIKITALAAAFILLALAAPQRLDAATVNVGAATWYAWWSPSFMDSMTGKTRNDSIARNVWYRSDAQFLLGPAVSVALGGRWNLSTVFLYGDWYSFKTRSVIQRVSSQLALQRVENAVKKWDLDSLASYALLDFLKVFVGVKWQGYIYHVEVTDSSSGSFSPMQLRVRSEGVGPGLGVALTLTLGADFYLLWNASALYLYSRMNYGNPQTHREVYSAFGCNSTLSIAWHLASANTTISLGFRYQFLDYRLWAGKSSDWSPQPGSESGLVRDVMTKDHFYGILLSAVYSFSI